MPALRTGRSKSSVQQELAFAIRAVYRSENEEMCVKYAESVLAAPPEDIELVRGSIEREYVHVGVRGDGVALYTNDAVAGLIRKACGITDATVNAAAMQVLAACFHADMEVGYSLCIVGSGAVELLEKQYAAVERHTPGTLLALAKFLAQALTYSEAFRRQWTRNISGGVLLRALLVRPLEEPEVYATSLRWLVRCAIVWYHDVPFVDEADAELFTRTLLKAHLAWAAPESTPDDTVERDVGAAVYELLTLNVIAQCTPLLEQTGCRLTLEPAWEQRMVRYAGCIIPLIADRIAPTAAEALDTHVLRALPVQYTKAMECLEGHHEALRLALSFELGFCALSICADLLRAGTLLGTRESVLPALLLVVSRLPAAKAKMRPLVDVRRKWDEVTLWCTDVFYTDGCTDAEMDLHNKIGDHWALLAPYPGLRTAATRQDSGSPRFLPATRDAGFAAPVHAALPALFALLLSAVCTLVAADREHAERVVTRPVFRDFADVLDRATYSVPGVLDNAVRLLIAVSGVGSARMLTLSSGVFAAVLKAIAGKELEESMGLVRALRVWLAAAPVLPQHYDAVRTCADLRRVLPLLRVAPEDDSVSPRAGGGAIVPGVRDAAVYTVLLGFLEDLVVRRPHPHYNLAAERAAVGMPPHPPPAVSSSGENTDEDPPPPPLHTICFADTAIQRRFITTLVDLLYCPAVDAAPLLAHPALMVQVLGILRHATPYRYCAMQIEDALYAPEVHPQLALIRSQDAAVAAALDALEKVLPGGRVADDQVGLGWSGNLTQIAVLAFVKDRRLMYVMRFQRFWRRRRAVRAARRLACIDIDEPQGRSAVVCDEAGTRAQYVAQHRTERRRILRRSVQQAETKVAVDPRVAARLRAEQQTLFQLDRAEMEAEEARAREVVFDDSAAVVECAYLVVCEAGAREGMDAEELRVRRVDLEGMRRRIEIYMERLQAERGEMALREVRGRDFIVTREEVVYDALVLHQGAAAIEIEEAGVREAFVARDVRLRTHMRRDRYEAEAKVCANDEMRMRTLVERAHALPMPQHCLRWGILQTNAYERIARIDINRDYGDGLVDHYRELVQGIERTQFTAREETVRWRGTSAERSAWTKFLYKQGPVKCVINEEHYRRLLVEERVQGLQALSVLHGTQRVEMLAEEEWYTRVVVERRAAQDWSLIVHQARKEHCEVLQGDVRVGIAEAWVVSNGDLTYYWVRRILRTAIAETLAVEVAHREELASYATAFITVLQLHATRELEGVHRRAIKAEEAKTLRPAVRRFEQEPRTRKTAWRLWTASADHNVSDITTPLRLRHKKKKHTRPCAVDPLAANIHSVRRQRPRPQSANPRTRPRFAEHIHKSVALASMLYASSPYAEDQNHALVRAEARGRRARSPSVRSLNVPFTPLSAF